jgi:CDP-paratose 2-epimerase
MRILITGACGFVGSTLAIELTRALPGVGIVGLDNLSRPGSERNRHLVASLGVQLCHGDIRNPSDLEPLPSVDWVIDAAANPSVLAGISGPTSSRQLVEHNLVGTINLLEFCKTSHAGFIMLSTSRVYSLPGLARIEVGVKDRAFVPTDEPGAQLGLTALGISEAFSTQPPLSLYGASKLASETLALEYGGAFDLPVFINRCGVLAGAGQFGKPDQGILSFWIHSYCHRKPLRYIGFGGTGHQVRDYLHPRDLLPLLTKQMQTTSHVVERIVNVGGGLSNRLSLAQLSQWCEQRFGPHEVQSEPHDRPYDAPWIVLDSSRAHATWHWTPATSVESIALEIALHAEKHPQWLEWSGGA